MTIDEIRIRYGFKTNTGTSLFVEHLEKEGIPLEEKAIDGYVAIKKLDYLKNKVEEVIDKYSGGGCLCGHSESCENCSPYSSKTTIVKKLKEAIKDVGNLNGLGKK